jgi:homoserine dehydrogenase
VKADVLFEFTPTNLKTAQPGLGHIETAMNMGLNVVTTNKGPLALAMPALLELARYKDVEFMFSGTVGGGTPILQLAKECLAANRILAVEGVLNGTTNYILTKMHDGVDFRDALTDAQRLGYAEADPSMDIGGFDTAAKLVILSNWAIGRKLSIRDVTVEGISEVTIQTIDKAKRSGGAVKLIGSASGGEASVKPQTVPSVSPLCVSGALNAVSLKTEFAGTVTLVGYGSGGTETAAAALRDLISIKQTLLGSDIT